MEGSILRLHGRESHEELLEVIEELGPEDCATSAIFDGEITDDKTAPNNDLVEELGEGDGDGV